MDGRWRNASVRRFESITLSATAWAGHAIRGIGGGARARTFVRCRRDGRARHVEARSGAGRRRRARRAAPTPRAAASSARNRPICRASRGIFVARPMARRSVRRSAEGGVGVRRRRLRDRDSVATVGGRSAAARRSVRHGIVAESRSVAAVRGLDLTAAGDPSFSRRAAA